MRKERLLPLIVATALFIENMDSTATTIMKDPYEGRRVDDVRLKQILALFRLEFRDPSLMLKRVEGRSVYLGLAMDKDGKVRVKPQNLVVNLPLRAAD